MIKVRPLKTHISRIFLTVLLFILVFLGLTFHSYRTFVYFIETDQAHELDIARHYERLMGAWQNTSNRRMEAYLLGIPLSQDEEASFKKNLDGIAAALETAMAGHRRLPNWFAIKALLQRYITMLSRFQTTLARISPKSPTGDSPSMRFYRQIASDGLTFQSSFDHFQANVASLGTKAWELGGQLPTGNASEAWYRVFDSFNHIDSTLASFSELMNSADSLPNRDLVFQLAQAVTRLEVRINFINTLLGEIEENATSTVELNIHQDLKSHVASLRKQIKSLLKQLTIEHVRTEELDNFHFHLRELRQQGISLCIQESNQIWNEIQQDSQRLLAQIHEKFILRLVILLISFSIGLSSLIILPSRISTPLEALRERFTTLVPGNPVTAAALTEIQEINELDGSFRGMVDRVNAGLHLHLRYFATIERIWEVVSSLEKKQVRTAQDAATILRSGIETILQFLGTQMNCVTVAGLLEVRPSGPVSMGTPYVSPGHSGDPATEYLRRIFQPAEPIPAAQSFFQGLIASTTNNPAPILCPRLPDDSKLILFRGLVGESNEFPHTGSCLGIRLKPRAEGLRSSSSLILFLYFHESAMTLQEADRLFADIIAQQLISLFETVQYLLLARQEQQLAQQLSIAKEIQETAIPRRMPDHPLLEIDAFIHMAAAVGGDFYDFFPLPDGRLALAIADVSGKSIPAALVTIGLKTGLRALNLERLTASEVVSHLQRILSPSISEAHFVTLLYCLIDPRQKTVDLANAGHTPCLWHRQRENGGEIEKIEIPSYPLGITDEACSRAHLNVKSGDTLYFYTDGVTDFRNEGRENFGESRLIKLFLETSSVPPAARLSEALRQFGGNAPIADDYAFISVRFRNPTELAAPQA
jgi:serine phosphatase RsbU (regulator of sigma subunit)